jgi:hypothetical protein
MFTILRDPIDRTISEFFFMRDDRRKLPVDQSLEDFLETDLPRSFNAQTAFLGGLTVRHNLEGIPLEREQFDESLLARAKRNLEAHDVVGLTERFDETLLLLRRAYRWPVLRTLYRPTNIGAGRRTAPTLSPEQVDSVRASNRLDIELFEFAGDLLERQLAERVPRSAIQLRRFRRLNGAYRRTFPIAHPPARALVRSARRLRSGF